MDKEKAELDEILECLTSAEDCLPGRKGSDSVEDYLDHLRRGNLACNVIQGSAFNADREKVRSLRIANVPDGGKAEACAGEGGQFGE